MTALPERHVQLSCSFEAHPAPRSNLNLLLAMPRPKVMKRMWRLIAELGVNRVYVTNAEKVERYYFDSHVLDETFIERELMVGLEQAQDTQLPVVSLHKLLKPLVEDVLAGAEFAAQYIAHPNTDSIRPGDETGEILLAIGPEGGWSDFELALFKKQDYELVSLGSRTLRTETALVKLHGVFAGVGS